MPSPACRAVALAAVCVLTACPKTTQWESKPVTDGASFLDAYHVAVCSWADRCGLLAASSKERCPEELATFFGQTTSTPSLSITTGAQSFDLDAAKACVASVDAAACKNGYPSASEDCGKVFKPGRDDGETCDQQRGLHERETAQSRAARACACR